MPGGVDEIDLDALIGDADVFGEDGYTPFAFDVVAVEKAGRGFFASIEKSNLFEYLVYQRGFAVVHVGDNRDITYFFHRILYVVRAAIPAAHAD